MRYSVVGLGKLGCSMAAAIASRGHPVIGYDVLEEHVAAVNAGRAPVQETGLAELIDANRARLRATSLVEEAVCESDVTFVVVPTPSDERGSFLLEHARGAFGAIGSALSSKRERHTVVLTSTVLPGSTRYGLVPALEEAAGRAMGDDFGVSYSPAFIALGTVVRDFLNPDLVLVGESDEATGDIVEAAYNEILPGDFGLRRMSLENAELAKIAVNTFVTTKISFANMLADLCERMPGGDVDAVTGALGLDRRIGRHYLKGALGYGGPCFPRDNQALAFFARALGTSAPIAEATDAINRLLPNRILQRIAAEAAGRTVAVLGLAYKPDTHVIDESQSLEIALNLAAGGARVLGHDPLAADTVRVAHGDAIEIMDDVQSCIDAADIVLITSPDPQYAQLSAEQFTRGGRTRVVVDFWRTLAHRLDGSSLIEYHALGRGDGGDGDGLRALWEAADDAVVVR